MAAAALDFIRVLHVDDEPDFSDLSATFIERQDDRFTVETASSASEGLDRLRQADFDCVVSDFDMPRQNGIEFLEVVRQEFPELPFILFTGKGSEEVASDAISAGVTDYIQKESGTSQYEVLANRVENVVEKYLAQEVAEKTEHRLQTIADNSNDVLWKFTADWNELLFINSQYEEIWGRSIDELREQPQSFLEGIHPDDRALAKAAMDQLSAGESIDIEYRVNAQENFGRWVWSQGEPVMDETGEVEKVVGFVRDITDRKEREQELRELERFNREIVEHAQVGIFRLDEEMQIIYENPGAKAIIGVPEGEDQSPAIGKDLRDLPSVQASGTIEALNRLEAGETVSFDTKFESIFGKESHLIGKGVPLCDGDDFDGAVIIVVDDTERRNREREQQETTRRLSLALEATETGVWEWNIETDEVVWSESLERLLGIEPGTFEGTYQAHAQYLHPDDIAEVERAAEEAIEGDRSFNAEFRMIRDDGKQIWVNGRAKHFSEDGSERLLGTTTDITELKEREQEIERLKDRFQAFTELASDVITVVDETGHIQYQSPSVERVLGYEPEELIGTTAFEHVHPDDQESLMETFETVVGSPGSMLERVTYRFKHADGSWVWLESAGSNRTNSAINGYVITSRDITERKKQERKREQIIERVTDAIVEVDADWRFTLVNEQAEELYDMSEESLLGRDFWEVFEEGKGTRFEEEYRHVMETREPTSFTEYFSQLDGWYDIKAYPSDDGGLAFYFVEVTEQKEREQELQNRTNQLQDIIDTVEGAMWIRNQDGEYEFMNQYHRGLFDIADDVDVAGKQFSDMLPAEVAEQFQENDQRVYETEESVEIEETVETDDGRRNFLTRIVPLFEDGSVYASCGIATDITERVEREQALEESEERYRKLLATAPTPILIYDQSEEVVYANHKAVELFGADDEEEILGLTPQDFIHPDSRGELDNRRRRLIDENQAVPPNELTILDRNGREKTVLVASSPITYEGEPAIQTVATDITELKDRERQLERYETLVEVSGDPMYMMDTEGHLEYVNEAYVGRIGYGEDELLGEHVSKVMVDDHVERGEELIQSLLTSGDSRGTFEIEAITKDDDRIPAEAHLSLLYLDGEFSGTVGVLRDITERLEREGRLQRERDRLDEFASVVSHDLRNPMSVAQGRLELAMEEHESEDLAAVERALHRMDRLIEDVLSLARVGESVGETEPVQLANLVEACWRNVDTDTAVLNVETEASIMADETRLQQLLENLIRNAVEHGGAEVAVTIGDVPDGFFVEDDGPGIPEDERDKVLNPGYSTRKEGTGFGLSIVRDIVQAHEWKIRVNESSKGGARFEITGVSTV